MSNIYSSGSIPENPQLWALLLSASLALHSRPFCTPSSLMASTIRTDCFKSYVSCFHLDLFQPSMFHQSFLRFTSACFLRFLTNENLNKAPPAMECCCTISPLECLKSPELLCLKFYVSYFHIPEIF